MPGVIVGVWIPGEGEWVAARGGPTSRPTSRSTDNQQKIGSITKTIASTVTLQVIGEREFDVTLDDTIDRWYPEFPEASNITVRMLLNMSSGTGEAGRAQVDRICATRTPSPTRGTIAIGAETPRADFAPGEGFTYANTNTSSSAASSSRSPARPRNLIDHRITEPFDMTAADSPRTAR